MGKRKLLQSDSESSEFAASEGEESEDFEQDAAKGEEANVKRTAKTRHKSVAPPPAPKVASPAAVTAAPAAESLVAKPAERKPTQDLPTNSVGSPPVTSPASAKKAKGSAKKASQSSDKKSAKKPATALGKTPENVVKDYMAASNRPFNVQTVWQNLEKKLPKPLIQTIMDQLTRSGDLLMKQYGKTCIYCQSQDKLQETLGNVSHAALDRLEAQYKQLSAQLQECAAEAKAEQAKTAALAAEPTDAELDTRLAELEASNEELAAKNNGVLSHLKAKASSGGGIDSDACNNARKGFNAVRAVFIQRQRKCKEMVETIAEGMEKKTKVVTSMLGFEPSTFVPPPKMQLKN